ncbi:TatD family hydrolase [Geomonas sp.]|uniref:TatD family hydrolase n=1 Tax=Geomonas sp. TaxID=2651584 RepID=UPI002B49C233|nr:TatD family hydrolase [Geomonas sp.]HJV34970.1 TatD family hydrolase [Geomonas sp.]
MFFDSHSHLDDPLLRSQLPALLADAEAAGVTGFLVPGVHPRGWQDIALLPRTFSQVRTAFGIHPMHADLATADTLSELRQLSRQATAIGEIGLDYLLPSPSREVQKAAFRSQLAIALQAGLPVLIHCRRAFPDLLAILAEHDVARVGGVMHAFSGSPETARDCLRLGLHISLAGTVTYSNAVRPVAVAACVPLDRLLIETDAPDLAPEPYRNGINLPAYLLATARRIAAIRGITVEELGSATTSNAQRLFRLDHSD